MTLRPYQAAIATKATEILSIYNIVYLSMQVRTGKTITALQTSLLRQCTSVMFVTKKKAISSIEDDYAAGQFPFSLLVINFEQLHNVAFDGDMVIIDEAHSIGQFPTPAERTKLLKKLCEGKQIIYLSGTPTPESYSQLFHQFFVSTFSPFKDYINFYKWANDYVFKKVKYMYNRQMNDYSHANKEKIDEDTKHLFISYTQEEAGFVQDVKEEVLMVEMSNKTYALAERLRTRRVFTGNNGEVVIADTELKLMQKLHQVYSGTVIVESGEAIAFDESKVKFIKEHFTGKKIAIFYKFKAELGFIYWHFGGNNVTADPSEFNNSDSLVFASQIQSGREGINLSTADALIFLNIDFSAVSYWQARARMQTKDRVKPCLIYWVFAVGGIEEKIYKAVQAKQDYTLSYFKKDERERTPNKDQKAVRA